MTTLEFDQLTEERQMNILRAFGTPVADRATGLCRYNLYAVSSFYVELYHDLLNNGRIKVLRSFDNPDFLDEYLKQIDVSSFNC